MTLQKSHVNSLIIFILMGICLAGFALRVYQLDSREIWGDEAFSIVTGALPLSDIIAPMVDMHPPLYYALNGGWMYSAGTSVFAMRYGTLLMNLLILPVAYGLARDFFGWRAGVLLALLCAMSPVYIYYAQELRMYSLLVLSTAISMWFFLRYSRRPSRLNAGVYLLATLIAMYTHYNAFLVIAAQNLIVLITVSWHGKRLRWFVGQGILALIYLPWAITNAEFMLTRFASGGDTGEGLSLASIGETAAQNLSSWLTGITAGDATLVFIVSVTGLILVLIALLRHPRQQRDVMLSLFMWGAFVLFAMSIMNSTAGYFHPRFAIAGVLPFLLLITYGAMLL
ncbi:MAG: glycosyltransferase family 39 protein, partial [Aggregatilineales bacterium]